jgi:chromosome segregation protein
MYLKSIVMQGFKSFANKIELDFHDGITCIVGPNGSGKSNVADAVRWVLGEQSARQLRGGNMQDVIFSGTESRKPLGFAMVSITFDNSDHVLAYDAEEVQVTRKLFRSGESEYRINGRACRLRDINELFFDTGIGKEGYSIIGQGQIDKILSGKPEDRRELFDEAAGIVKFKRRKAASVKKLEGEEQNLVRVKDILKELEERKDPLKGQAEKAERYLVLRDDLKEADLALFCRDSERISVQMEEARKAFEIATGHQKEVEAEFSRTKQEYGRIEEELAKLEEEIRSARDRCDADRTQRQQAENEIRILNEQIRSGIRNEEVLKKRVFAIDEEKARREEEANTQKTEKESLSRQLLEIGKRRDESAADLESIQEKIRTLSTDTEQNRSETISLLNRRTSIKEKLQRYDTMLEQIEIRRSEISSALLQSASERRTADEEQEKLKKAHDEAVAGVTEHERTQKETESLLASLKQKLDQMNHDMEIGQSAYHRESSRLESLRNLAERYEGYGNSVKRVMARKDENPGIHGVVAELLQTDRRYETAIETALGGSMQNIVTDNERTAKDLIEYLKHGHYGRATFLPLTSVKPGRPFDNENALSETGVLGTASTLIRCERIYNGIAESLLGRTLVVDTIDHAIQIGRKYRHSIRMVTLEGELLNPGGSMTGGSYRNSSNLLGRTREIEDLAKSVSLLKKELTEMQEKIQSVREKRQKLRKKDERLQEELQKLYLDENTSRLGLESWSEKQQTLFDHENQLNRELSELQKQTSGISEEKKNVTAMLSESKDEENRLSMAVKDAQESIASLQKEEENARNRHSAVLLEFANAKQKKQFLDEQLKADAAEIRRLDAERARLITDAQKESSGADEKRGKIEEQQKIIEALGESVKRQTEKIENGEKKKEEMNRSHRTFFEKRDALSEERSEIDRECFRLNARIEKLTEENDQLTSGLWENYEMTPDAVNLPEKYADTPPGDLKKEASSFRKQIRSLGDINVNAIDEYKELKKRYDFLSGQYEDIVRATESLQDIIRKLDVSMRRRFKEKFAEIQKEYNKVFRELFGGGAGTLELVEDEDVLDAGIIISAQPPGKKLQNMMQLSGGEKALTAIALLFAIQNLKPSPFCLLDEIEAALDDANVNRYSEYLHKLTKNTQFIIITHRRGTMAAADRLYGITMQEKGVSALVSVKLIENELDQ